MEAEATETAHKEAQMKAEMESETARKKAEMEAEAKAEAAGKEQRWTLWTTM